MIVKTLLKKGADPLLTDKEGQTVLHFASYLGDPERASVKIKLLSSIDGVDVNARDINGNTPLHTAVLKKSERAVAALLKVGADPVVEKQAQQEP